MHLIVMFFSSPTSSCIVGGFLSDKFGPKRVLICSGFLMVICAVVQAAQDAIGLLLAFRGISGLGVGVISIIAPLYATEWSNTKRRGMIVSMYQVVLTFGMDLAYLVNYFFNEVEDGWRFNRMPNLSHFFISRHFLFFLFFFFFPS